jgi:hypothetical protein
VGGLGQHEPAPDQGPPHIDNYRLICLGHGIPTHPKSTCNTWIIDGDGRIVNRLYQTLVQKLTPDCPEWPWREVDKQLTNKIMKLASMSARDFMAVRGKQLALLRTRADRHKPLGNTDCSECGKQETDPAEHPYWCEDTTAERKGLVAELRSMMAEEGYARPVFFAEVPGLKREKRRGEDSWRICKKDADPPRDGKYLTLAATWNGRQLDALARGGIEPKRCRSVAAKMTQIIASFLLRVSNSRRAPESDDGSDSDSNTDTE